MASIVVCGGSVIGLSTAMMLARDGHEVTVLEADPAPPPLPGDGAWRSWERKGVAQFHQPHNLFPRVREIADAELPGLTDALLAAGAVWVDYLETPPPTIPDRDPRPGDDRFRFVTGRRPVVESVVATRAANVPGVTIRRGVRVEALVAGADVLPGVPHVVGVRTAAGEELRADLVVDAMGRRTPTAGWLTDLGGRAPSEEAEDSGFVYYTRYLAGPDRPRRRAPANTPIGSISVVTLDGDNDTWSVTVFGPTRDPALKTLRDREVFDRVIGACPAHAHWLEGKPISDVVAMAGILDRYRRFVVDGQPVVTGLAAVGDAWACTNPSAARGLSLGLIHAQQLRRTVAEHLDDPAAFARAWDDATEREATPYYRTQIAADRARIAQMEALRNGVPPPPPDPAAARLYAAAMRDGEVFRAFLEIVMCLALPEQVLARPGLRERVERVAADNPPPQPVPGPDRARLVELLTA
jgi:2-polyprenyl-6-methoxyphenol hydroxylase-like FAD-dependent oxidoreductase